MNRGTTPTIYVHVPNTINTANVVQAWLSFAQDKRLLIDKDIDDATINGQIFAFTLTQEETLELDADIEVLGQFRILMNDGTALASQIAAMRLGDVIKEGVIE